MDDVNESGGYLYTDIDATFHCDSTGQPFKRCVECDGDLMESGKSYFVEKAIRKYPNSDKTLTIFEFAICANCIGIRQQELSVESAAAMQKYFSSKSGYRPWISVDNMEDAPKLLTSSCMLSGKDISDCEEYQLVAELHGNKMRLGNFPFAISGEEIEAISEVLSEKTKEEFDDFIGRHFGGPPEFKELWEKPKVVLV